MKKTLCLWLVAGLIAGVCGQKLVVNPKVIQPGIHKELHVQCSFLAKSQKFSQLLNLSISFLKDMLKTDFTTLATINALEGIKNFTEAVVTGVVDQSGGSLLNLTWAYPSQDRDGVYSCVAEGLDKGGQVATARSSVKVKETKPNLQRLLEKLKDQDMRIEQLTADEVAHHRREDWFKKELFHVSDAYNGLRFYLSESRFSTTEKGAAASCEQIGGHLAEYETEGEFEFILSFLSKFPNYTCVMTSGSDEEVENTWLSQRTRTPLRMIKWSRKEPNGARFENCLGFWKNSKWDVGDIPCEFNTDRFVHGYLCEVPVSGS